MNSTSISGPQLDIVGESYTLFKNLIRWLQNNDNEDVVPDIDARFTDFVNAPHLHTLIKQSRYEEVVCHLEPKLIPQLQAIKEKKKTESTTKQTELSRLQLAWSGKYCGTTVDNFTDVINEAERNFNIGESKYGKLMDIVNSSGLGKSRTVDEYAKKVLGVVYTLRRRSDNGYPPGDNEIFDFLRRAEDTSETNRAYEHARVIALFSATIGLGDINLMIDIVREHLRDAKDTFPKLPGHFNALMAPTGNTAPELRPRAGIADRISETRSQFRKDFCRNVVKRARSILARFKAEDEAKWLGIFAESSGEEDGSFKNSSRNMYTHSLVVQFLIDPLHELVESLRKARLAVPGVPAFFFCFDEATNLNTAGEEGTLLSTIKRVVHLIQDEPVWTLTISSRNTMPVITPVIHHDQSQRIMTRELIRVRPFFAFSASIEYRERMAKNRDMELRRSVTDFGTLEHLSAFGRPLWHAHAVGGASLSQFRAYVMRKLLNFRDSQTADLDDRYHVLALMSGRVVLDLVSNDENSLEIEDELIHSHLRCIYDVNEVTGSIRSTWLEEPAVSDAVAEFFGTNPVEHWRRCLDTLYRQCCATSLIDRERMGELVAQQLCCIGRDLVFNAPRLLPSPGRGMLNTPFTVESWLRKMFTNASVMLSSSPTISNRARKTPPTLHAMLGNGYLNFTHFTDTSSPLIKDKMRELLHGLLISQTACLLKPGQPLFDLLFPVYLGDPTAEFDENLIGAIAIQAKNRKEAVTWDLTDKKAMPLMAGMFPENMPVLALLLELGAKGRKSVFKPIRTVRDNHFGWCIGNSGAESYKLMTDRLEGVLDKLLGIVDRAEDIQARVAMRNRSFRFHTFEERFDDDGRDIEDEEEDEDNGDDYALGWLFDDPLDLEEEN